MQAKWTTEDGIRATVMAIREELMCYYKDTCIDRFAQSNVQVMNSKHYENLGHRLYYYERRERDNNAKRILFVSDAPLLFLQKAPNELAIVEKIANRSAELTAVAAAVEKFMHDYLGGVEVKHYTGGKPEELPSLVWPTTKRDDSKLVMQNTAVTLREEIPEAEEATEEPRSSSELATLQRMSELQTQYYERLVNGLNEMDSPRWSPSRVSWSEGYTTLSTASEVQGLVNAAITTNGTITPREPRDVTPGTYIQHYDPDMFV